MFQNTEELLLALARSRQQQLLEEARQERLVRSEHSNGRGWLGTWVIYTRCRVEQGWANGRRLVVARIRHHQHAAPARPYEPKAACSETATRRPA